MSIAETKRDYFNSQPLTPEEWWGVSQKLGEVPYGPILGTIFMRYTTQDSSFIKKESSETRVMGDINGLDLCMRFSIMPGRAELEVYQGRAEHLPRPGTINPLQERLLRLSCELGGRQGVDLDVRFSLPGQTAEDRWLMVIVKEINQKITNHFIIINLPSI